MGAEEVKALGDKAQHFSELKQTKAWSDLKDVYAERKRKAEKEWLSELWDGKQPDTTYQRGFLDGIEFLIRNVDAADAKFERALKRLKGQ